MNDRQVKIKSRLYDFLSQSIGKLTDNEINDIKQDIDAGEWVLAYETLVTQLYEHDIKLNQIFFEGLKDIGKELDVEERY